MKSFTAIVAALTVGMFLICGAPAAQAQECEQRVIEAERQIQELQPQIEQLAGVGGIVEARRTTAGAVFTRVAPVHRDFGESWRDPSGVIWGDVAKNADGSILIMDQGLATKYCRSRGGRLPSREDFVRLREYLGARPGTHEGYTPQVLPNLTRELGGLTFSNLFWSESVEPDFPLEAYDFDGRDGYIVHRRIYELPIPFEVRCVAPPLAQE